MRVKVFRTIGRSFREALGELSDKQFDLLKEQTEVDVPASAADKLVALDLAETLEAVGKSANLKAPAKDKGKDD